MIFLMNKDTNMRIAKQDLFVLHEIATAESRTLKAMFKLILKYYKEKNYPEIK